MRSRGCNCGVRGRGRLLAAGQRPPCALCLQQGSRRTLFIRRQRLQSAGGFSLLLLHCLSHVALQDMSCDSSPAFRRLFFRVTAQSESSFGENKKKIYHSQPGDAVRCFKRALPSQVQHLSFFVFAVISAIKWQMLQECLGLELLRSRQDIAPPEEEAGSCVPSRAGPSEGSPPSSSAASPPHRARGPTRGSALLEVSKSAPPAQSRGTQKTQSSTVYHLSCVSLQVDDICESGAKAETACVFFSFFLFCLSVCL